MGDPGDSPTVPADTALDPGDRACDASDGVRILGVRRPDRRRRIFCLGAALRDELAAGQTRILVDLEGVDYVSSAGLLALQEAAASARDRGARLALCRLSEPVRVAFDLAGLTGEFAIEASCEAGVARLVLA